ELRDTIGELRDLGGEARDQGTQLGVLAEQLLSFRLGHVATRSCAEIRVDPLSTWEATKPSAARDGEVDAREQRRERCAVDGHLSRVLVEGGELEAPRLQALREDAPPRAIEPDHLRDAAPLVEEEVEVAI